MMTARELNMVTSLRVFCGSHLPDEAAQEINDKYWLITQALELVNFPLALPGTKVYKAIQARKAAMRWLELAASRSKAAMAAGGEPECMLDEWITILSDPNYKGRKEFSDKEMGMVILSFLFASQDAMSSGLIYLFQHLSDHPEIMAKVREEQERVRKGDFDAPLTLDLLDSMVYLQATVKESMRVKPPVTMVCWRVLVSHADLLTLLRFLTVLQSRSPSLTTMWLLLVALLSLLSSTPSMTPPYILSPRRSGRRDGSKRTAQPMRTPETTSCLEVVPTSASASSTPA
jgi:cytochrome P450